MQACEKCQYSVIIFSCQTNERYIHSVRGIASANKMGNKYCL